MKLPIDEAVVEECRALAAQVAADVHGFIDRHTTVSIERTVLRAYGVEGANSEGVPLCNTCVDRFAQAGTLGRGIAYFLGRALAGGAATPQEAAETLAYGSALDDGGSAPTREAAARALAPWTGRALATIDRARERRVSDRARLGGGAAPLQDVVVGTGRSFVGPAQDRAAAHAGARPLAAYPAPAK